GPPFSAVGHVVRTFRSAIRRPEGPALLGVGVPPDKAAESIKSMNVSPLDLRQQKFNKSFRGFDPVEVTAFMMAVAEDYEQALREADRLRTDLTRLEAVLNEHREHERNLKRTLLA